MPNTKADRRTTIADTVIRILGKEGSRALTHRAVDEAAGLPAGSTSYYFRSRADLIACAVPRLAQLDARAIGDHARDDPRDLLVGLMRRALTGSGRVRTVARYELALEAARRPELQREMTEGTDRLIDLLADLMPGEDAHARARDTLAFVDGVLLAEVTTPASRRRSADELVAAVDRLIA